MGSDGLFYIEHLSFVQSPVRIRGAQWGALVLHQYCMVCPMRVKRAQMYIEHLSSVRSPVRIRGAEWGAPLASILHSLSNKSQASSNVHRSPFFCSESCENTGC